MLFPTMWPAVFLSNGICKKFRRPFKATHKFILKTRHLALTVFCLDTWAPVSTPQPGRHMLCQTMLPSTFLSNGICKMFRRPFKATHKFILKTRHLALTVFFSDTWAPVSTLQPGRHMLCQTMLPSDFLSNGICKKFRKPFKATHKFILKTGLWP